MPTRTAAIFLTLFEADTEPAGKDEMHRFVNIATWVFVVVVLAAIFLHSCQRQELKAEIGNLSDTEYIINNLKIRGADDCKLTSIQGGWKCVEMQSGKIFIVRKP